MSARRAARIWLTTALVACAGLAVAAGHQLSAAVDDPQLGLPLVGVAAIVLFLLPFLARGGEVELHDQRYLSALTFSGERTLDLHRLVRIRRFRVVGRFNDVDMLVLVDADGVRLMVDGDEVDRAVRQALACHRSDRLRVSRQAQSRLDLFEPTDGLLFWWFLCRLGVTFLYLPVCAVPPALVAWAVSALL